MQLKNKNIRQGVAFLFLSILPKIPSASVFELTIFTVDGLDLQGRLEGVLHLVATEVIQVFLLDQIALLLLQRKPRAGDEPLSSHDRDMILLCQTSERWGNAFRISTLTSLFGGDTSVHSLPKLTCRMFVETKT